jgi:rhamnose utilization protein RhaD (predicted bifunctional aldolase and dehydrogenase)
MSVLDQLVELSHELGREDRRLAILGEGNTSADCGDGSFWIKGSGSRLATIRAEQFCRVRAEDVLQILDRPEISERDLDAALAASLAEPSKFKPSIETLLHALCLMRGEAKFVGHTHAESALAILSSRHGAEPFLRHIFPDAVVMCGRAPMVVPYADPGLPLAIAFRESLERFWAEHKSPPKLVLMVNHGIVALGQTASEVLNITLMAQKWARVLLDALAIGGAEFIPDESAQRLDARLDEHYRRRQLGQ